MAGTFTFPSMASVSDPVTPAQAAPFASSYEVVGPPNLQRTQRLIIIIVSLMDYLKTHGDSHDYTTASAQNQMFADAQAFTGGLSNFDLDRALCVLLYNLAKSANASLSADISTLTNTGKQFEGYPENRLEKIIALLLYRSF